MPTHPNLSLNAGPSQQGKPENAFSILHLSLNSQPALHISTPAVASTCNRRSVRFAAVESYLSARSQGKFRPIPSLHMNHIQSPNLKSCATCLLPDLGISSCLMSRRAADCPSNTITQSCPRARTPATSSPGSLFSALWCGPLLTQNSSLEALLIASLIGFSKHVASCCLSFPPFRGCKLSESRACFVYCCMPGAGP